MYLTTEQRKKVKEEKRKRNKEEWAKRYKPGGEMGPGKALTTREGAQHRMKTLKEKLLSKGNSETVVRKLLEIATNDEHPGQVQALRMCIDRMLPVSMFEDKEKNRPEIKITILGVGDDVSQPDIIEGERLE